jgi:hypothetical protein
MLLPPTAAKLARHLREIAREIEDQDPQSSFDWSGLRPLIAQFLLEFAPIFIQLLIDLLSRPTETP